MMRWLARTRPTWQEAAATILLLALAAWLVPVAIALIALMIAGVIVP